MERNEHMKRKKLSAVTCVILLLLVFLMSECAKKDEKTKVRVLILPNLRLAGLPETSPAKRSCSMNATVRAVKKLILRI